MAKFTADVDLNLDWFGNQLVGVSGTTHRIPDALYDEFNGTFAGKIPGLTWVEQDETTAAAIAADVATALALKYDKTGGTVSGAVVATGAITGASLSAVGAINGASIVGATVSATTLSADSAIFDGSPHIDAKAYGATGDGVTDDTTALQNAINALTTGLNATLFIPAGTYVVSSSLLIPYMQYKRILGAGPNATILQATMTNSPIIKTQEENTHTIEIADIGLWYATQRSASNTSAMGIMFAVTSAGVGSGFYHWRVSNVGIYRAGVGIGIDPNGTGSIPVWGSLFQRIIITSVAYRGVSMEPISGGNVQQTWIDLKINNNGTTVVATNYAFKASSTEVTIIGLDVEKWHGPIFYDDGGPPATLRGIHIEHHTATAAMNLFEGANGALSINGLWFLNAAVQNGAALTIARAGDGAHLSLDGARIDVTLTSGTAIWATAHSTAGGTRIRGITDANNNATLGMLDQPFIGPLAPWFANTTNVMPSAGMAMLYSFRVESAVRVGRGIIQISTASGSVDMGIYDANGTRLASSGSTVIATGSRSAAFTTPVLLVPGKKYYAAIAVSDASTTVGDFTSIYPGTTGNSVIAVRVASSFPLPATIVLGTLPAQRYYPVTFEP